MKASPAPVVSIASPLWEDTVWTRQFKTACKTANINKSSMELTLEKAVNYQLLKRTYEIEVDLDIDDDSPSSSSGTAENEELFRKSSPGKDRHAIYKAILRLKWTTPESETIITFLHLRELNSFPTRWLRGLAVAYLDEITRRYPRYRRDQFAIIHQVIQKYPQLIDTVIIKCMAERLYSANDFETLRIT